jgi:hypothetical protein
MAEDRFVSRLRSAVWYVPRVLANACSLSGIQHNHCTALLAANLQVTSGVTVLHNLFTLRVSS